MKIAIISNDYLYNNIESFKQCAHSYWDNATIQAWTCKTNDNIFSELSEYQPSIIVTENLAGFHMCTYTGNVAYNLIHAFQLHFIYCTSPFPEQIAEKIKNPLSLLMHFECCDTSKKRELLHLNPDIPYIDVLPSPMPDTCSILKIIGNNKSYYEKKASE